MKSIKFLITLILLQINLFAQQGVNDGIYETTFGNISWTAEQGSDYPNGSIVYGDFKDKGTFTGSISGTPGKEELNGDFFNGSSLGKFIFFPTNKQCCERYFIKEITSFYGFWGYDTDNKYSGNEGDKWEGKKVSGINTVQNVTNVWSGKWNTTDGPMYLMQVGRKITGTYKGVGTVDGLYNAETRILKAKFLNKNINKTGYLEFTFEGNSFKGKWGWNSAMTEGNWEGQKQARNNKELPVQSVKPSAAPPAPATNANNNIRPYDVNFQFDYLAENHLGVLADNFYGIGWCRLMINDKKTQQVVMVNPYLSKYIDKFGRVYEIPRAKSIEVAPGEIKSLMNGPIRFRINPADYGYGSIEQMKGEAYFEVQFEAKVKNLIGDDILGKQLVRVYLENANIEKVTYDELNKLGLQPQARPGIINIQNKDYNYAIYFSFKASQ